MGDASREPQGLQRFSAREAADRDLSLRSTDDQALSRCVPGSRAYHTGVAGKGQRRLPLQVPEQAVRLVGGWMEPMREQMPAAGMEGQVVLDPFGRMNEGAHGQDSLSAPG